MPEPMKYVLDLSGREISWTSVSSGNGSPEPHRLSWNVAFELAGDHLRARLGEAFDALSLDAPNQARFPDLHAYIHLIGDSEVLALIFEAMLEHMHQASVTPSENQQTLLYLVYPYHWPDRHRKQLRSACRRYAPQVRLRLMLSDILCVLAYVPYAVTSVPVTDPDGFVLYLFDSRQSFLQVWRVESYHSEGDWSFDLLDSLQIPRYQQLSPEACVQRIVSAMQLSEHGAPLCVLIGAEASGEAFARALADHRNMQTCHHVCIDQPQDVVLRGADLLLSATRQEFHFKHQCGIGVQFPDGTVTPLIETDCEFPTETYKGFRLVSASEPFFVDLCSGLSLCSEGNLHRLASFEIDPRSGNEPVSEFVLSVELSAAGEGNGRLHIPGHDPMTVAFRMPQVVG